MIATLLTTLLILAVGTEAGNRLIVRQQEAVLSKLSEADAAAYYDLLRRRARRVRTLRAVVVASLLCLLYAYRHRPI